MGTDHGLIGVAIIPQFIPHSPSLPPLPSVKSIDFQTECQDDINAMNLGREELAKSLSGEIHRE
jgi:hypothetical protein